MNHRITGLLVAIVALLLDQGSKALALSTLLEHSAIDILPFLNFVLIRNDGVSFGMLGGVAPWWGLSALAMAIVAVLSVWLYRSDSWGLSVALGLVIGGALGNVLDRARFGAVIDFLDFHAAGYHWPAFNVADIAVVCGAGILILDSLLVDRTQASKAG